MNNYLFHGKRKDNGEWVEGSLIIVGNRYFIASNKIAELRDTYHIFSSCHELSGDFVDIKQVCEIIPETVSMWTGVTDRNWERVFESDIIQARFGFERYIGIVRLGKYRAGGNTHIGFYIEWGLGYGYKDMPKGLVWWFENSEDGIEIIDNIHDNPELLEGEAWIK